MGKDWIGNSASTYKTLGASNYCEHQREQNDYYATEPRAAELLLELETFAPSVWECACGEGHIAKVLEKAGYQVYSSDLIDRGFGIGGVDFLVGKANNLNVDIITNPPYKYAREFVEKALEVICEGRKVAMFLKIQFLESQGRRTLFEKYPPKIVYVPSARLQCGINGKFFGSSAVCYAWFVWVKGFKGEPVIRWFN